MDGRIKSEQSIKTNNVGADALVIFKKLLSPEIDIEVKEDIIKEIERLKNGLMAKIFREGINKKELKKSRIGLIPEDWEDKGLDEVFTIPPRVI